jgi:hypothetical protein
VFSADEVILGLHDERAICLVTLASASTRQIPDGLAGIAVAGPASFPSLPSAAHGSTTLR